MYTAMEIAVHVINYVKGQNGHISNLKLQKILYYIQAAFLCERGEVCFDEKILCWRHGPVVQSVYNKFSIYGGEEIPEQRTEKKIVFKNGRFVLEERPVDGGAIRDGDRELIDRVVDGLKDYDPWYLVDKTHEEAPWKNLGTYNTEITPQAIEQYFVNHRERVYGHFDR